MLQSPKPPTIIAPFIIETMTKNSVIRGWSSARIVGEVLNTPSWQPISRSMVYRVLIESSYSVFRRIVKSSLTEEIKKPRLQFCLDYKD